MAPRQSTIIKLVEKAMEYIDADRCANARRTLQTLNDKLTSTESKPKKPNAYAEFVKEKFPFFRKQHPEKNATEIMPLIAAAWKAKKV
jgi:hypothetical protein